MALSNLYMVPLVVLYCRPRKGTRDRNGSVYQDQDQVCVCVCVLLCMRVLECMYACMNSVYFCSILVVSDGVDRFYSFTKIA